MNTLFRYIAIILFACSTNPAFGQINNSSIAIPFAIDTTHINEPDSIIFYHWNELLDAWEPRWMDVIVYNKEKAKQVEINYIIKNGIWQTNHKTDFNYSSYFLDNKVYSGWDDYDMVWMPMDKITFQYNTNGNTIQMLDSKWSVFNKNWLNDSLLAFYYNDSQQLVTSNVSIWSSVNSVWENLTETSYGYFSKNNIRKLFSTWDFDYLNWKTQQLDTLTFSDNYELMEEKHMYYSQTSWVNDWLKTYQYYNNGLIKDEFLMKWDEIRQEYVDASKWSYYYDANWNLTRKMEFYFDWDLLLWSNKFQTFNEFSLSNKIVATTYSYWNYEKWNPLYHYTYFYTEYTEAKDGNLTLNMMVYPNPAKEVLYIQFQKNTNKDTFVSLHDATGRMVYKQTLNHFYSEHQITLPHLKSGIYFLKVRLDNEEITRKISILN
jgi:hypothetical protein